MKIGYVRVSSADQNETRQIEGLEKYGIDKWYTEKVSGKNTNRPQLQQMIEFAREGDTIYIHDFSRLARSTRDLLDITEKLQEKGIHLVSNKENIDTFTPTGKLLFIIVSAIAEFERTNLLERQKEGISIAKRNGVYSGRKPFKSDKDKFEDLYSQYISREINKTEFAKLLGTSCPTLDKLIREHENKNK